uniref:Uncharacterized protein LOC104220618 n=1 Tax=Nicotiana sylvestris TaxID=4096 RepID=A0A1U7VXY3_NICSY|nr:PREDICTED: uncharacterized protein LOC104220618 [Nicotiana sylvestris]
MEGNWVEGSNEIADAALNYFDHLFSADITVEDSNVLSVVKRVVTNEDNDDITIIPNLEEVKEAVFSIDPHSSPSPDGLTGKFINHGATLPKFFTHTYIIMLPKVEAPQSFSDIRPINLCNVSSKIIAKILNARLSKIFPKIITQNQSGFVKGRAITENILLAQELVNDIGKPRKGANVVIKLDMAKAYDRVSWPFLCFMLRKLGFAEVWIDLIHGFISNNWYSIIVNGGRHGFFKSGRGLRQGDPLSLSLFILYAELLSQMLNNLYTNSRYKGYFMNDQGPKINHLSFANDTIIFSSSMKFSLQLTVKTFS